MWGGTDATHAHAERGPGPSWREMVALGRGAGASGERSSGIGRRQPRERASKEVNKREDEPDRSPA